MAKYLIPDGVYEFDFAGTSDAEFIGKHPAIIIRILHEPTLYVVIPLTSFTEERWKSNRPQGACKMPSIDSIAKVCKMQIFHERDINKRWFKRNKLLIPTVEEIEDLHEHIIKEVTLSCDKSLKLYKKFHQEIERFQADCKKLFDNNIDATQFTSQGNNCYTYPQKELKNLTITDIKDCVRRYAPNGNWDVIKDTTNKQIIVTNTKSKN